MSRIPPARSWSATRSRHEPRCRRILAVGERVVHKSFPPITRHTLALYCGASGDHNPIHVDSDFARSAGFPDVFAHGMLVMAFLGQALTDAVPPASIRSFSTRFAAITQLGARLTCEGHVTELFEHKGERRARLTLTTKDENNQVKLAAEAVIAL
jgi:acyl dehydratase